jgi:hypothetical protein
MIFGLIDFQNRSFETRPLQLRHSVKLLVEYHVTKLSSEESTWSINQEYLCIYIF